jgi:diaminohydroxyphosphoribosylaminopyrimidine deaminase/5-amino-6-(5-phosphoribosylamino)uracil reductase
MSAPPSAVTGPAFSAADDAFMREALTLAAAALGLTAPNPAVGAVVVNEGQIVGRGATRPGGRPHAERMALEQAGEAAEGATIYVTLEPCARRSQRVDTAACTDLIIAAGIRRVVFAVRDPSPNAAREGPVRMMAAGLQVEWGLREAEARRLTLGHILRITRGRPMVTLKLALTPDGYVAEADGRPLAVTGAVVRDQVHRMRAAHDAIMVGIGTVLADDPRLTVRIQGLDDRSPTRVVLDTRLGIPEKAALVATAREVPTWVIAGIDAPVAPERALRRHGVEVMRVRASPRGGLDLSAALTLIGSRGITRLMAEGGPRIADALARADLIDDAVIFHGATVLDRPGLPGIRPGLARWLEATPVAEGPLPVGTDLMTLHRRER